jgi:hypothetical protein
VTPLREASRIAVAAVAFTVLAAVAPALAVGGEGESWPSFNESQGCGSPWAIGPNAETTGPLDLGTILRGPQAAHFGRTVGQVADSLVPWAVPMSDGEVLNVHRRTLPVLAMVTRGLTDAADRGWVYDIWSAQTFGYTPRTVGGRIRVSQHAFGNAVDVNSLANPHTDGPLVTNMPGWFVDAWKEAGFCWGGDWVDQSDAMHFSWRGPSFTAGYTSFPQSYPPLTDPEPFTRTIYRHRLPPPREEPPFEVLMDADGDGAVDVVRVFDRGPTVTVEVLTARSGYVSCTPTGYRVPHEVHGGVAIPGDWNRDGIQDVWIVDDSGPIIVTPLLANDRFTPGVPVTIDASPGDIYLSVDFDVDGWSDLYILRRSDQGWDLEVRGGADRFSTVLTTRVLAADPSSLFTAIDRDLDFVPDLVAISQSGIVVFDGAARTRSTEAKSFGIAGVSDVAGTDFDGDGRHDIASIRDDVLRVYSGNTPLDGVGAATWFFEPELSCDGVVSPLPGDGSGR